MSAQVSVLGVLLPLVLVPGLLIGLAAGLRGWALAATAPLLTYGVVAVSAPVVPVLLGRWSIWGMLLATAVIALIVLGARLLTRRWGGAETKLVPWQLWQHAGIAGAVLVAAALGVFITARATHGLTDVHQFWDAMFHANAVRFIEETGQSNPPALRNINDFANTGFFYPNGFHVVAATALGVTGAPITVVLNSMAALLAGLVSLSVAAVIRVAGGRPLLAGSAALAAALFSAFPYDLEFFGPIWPFGTGLALMPAFLALFITMLDRRRWSLVLPAALGFCGLVSLHPSVTLTGIIFGTCYLVQRWVVARKVSLPELGLLVVTGVIAGVNAVPQLLGMAGTASSGTFEWPLYANAADALGQLFFLGHEAQRPQWWLVALMILGLVGIKGLRPMYWWLAGGVVFSGLFVLTTSYKGQLVALLTGFWWNDRWRFAAIVVVAMTVLAGHGVVVARDGLVALFRRFPIGTAPWLRLAAAVVVVGLLAALTDGFYQGRNVQRIAGAYTGPTTVTEAERDAMDRLPELVGEDDLVMNDAADGSAWMWALEEVRPVFGHALNGVAEPKVVGEDRAELFTSFNRLDSDREVRAIVERLKVTYVFEGWGFAAPGIERAPGMRGLDQVKSLELVFSNEQAKIYKVRLDQVTTP
ncbi:hypothetical protein SAMN05216553_12224 [Lentzea fradiae]|uniref:Uncharacterized protein n=1 Tax=Lentzea fradiae TaxID=200378 RepID=A0A1G8CDN8_9PSEU|nr:DUF6541 family protein [Lentzea fradiae]SDH43616.1 hypothetical protein SAMN05216553_12224 [Lentzea fradiae]